ncbi:hypothetical protein HZB89_00385 [archaeon]|nr:hypothetical protein [archaeon]
MKLPAMSSHDLMTAMKEVAGTCKSMGVTIEGIDPVQVIEEIKSGKFKA